MTDRTKTPLNTESSARYEKLTGVTYFKLKSNFPGDYTKNCGLLAEEIDKNFYFLRGYDIKDVFLDDERNLIITRVDKCYPPIKVNLDEEFKKTIFEFDRVNGTIIVTYPDGTKDTMEGFLVQGKDVKVATDASIDGDGGVYNPLRLAGVERTGTFAPVESFIDITDNMGTLPEGEYRGQRIVSKEKLDVFGRLYTMQAVKEIQSALTATGSEWRVPSKKDWDDLLNSLECEEYRNHSAITSSWLGEVAGSALKSKRLWELNEFDDPCEVPSEGHDVLGLRILPVGVTPDRNDILQALDSDVEGFGKMTGMWTSTINPEGNAFVKIFGYNHAEVYQDTYGNGARLSLRLVKDYRYDNSDDMEYILGLPYPTQLVHGIHKDYPYIKVWTKINFYSNEFDGCTYKGWSAVTEDDRSLKTVYYINEFIEGKWHKKQMREGDSVVILNYEQNSGETINNHEWRVIDGELVDTVSDIMDEFDKTLTEINGKIDTLSSATQEFSAATVEAISSLNTKIEEEKDRAISAETVLNDSISEEKIRAISAETALNDAIYAERDRAIAVESALNRAIEAEKDRAQGIESELNDAISAEKKRAISVETALNEAIYAERDRAIEAESALTVAVNTEKERAIAVETELNEAIYAEKNRAISAETVLNDAIYAERDRAIEVESALTIAIETEKNRAIAAETALNDALEDEKDRVDNLVIDLTSQIEDEKDRAISAETALNDAIYAERNRAIEVESALTIAIETEKNRAISVESELNEAIYTEKERAISAETELNNAISAEKIRAISAETALNEAITQEVADRIANDLIPAQYILSGDSSDEIVIPTYGEEVEDVRIRISDDFFNFGTF